MPTDFHSTALKMERMPTDFHSTALKIERMPTDFHSTALQKFLHNVLAVFETYTRLVFCWPLSALRRAGVKYAMEYMKSEDIQVCMCMCMCMCM